MGEGQGRSARRRAIVSAVMLAAIVALILAGCTVSASSGAPIVVTSLHVLRSGDNPLHHIPPLDRTVSDAAKVQHLYNVLHALPPFPRDQIMHCPADFGVLYHLTFYHDGAEVSWATVNPYGCQGVTLPNGDIRWSANVDYLWQVFADALGVPESDLPHMSFDSSAPRLHPVNRSRTQPHWTILLGSTAAEVG